MNLGFLKYLSIYFSVGIICLSLYAGGLWVFLAPVYVFGIIPLLELFLPYSTANMSKAEEEVAKKDIKFDIIVWTVLPMQIAVVLFFLNRITQPGITWWEMIGMTIAAGISCGVQGINVAHELGHRNTWYEQLMSKVLLATSLYMHFFIEHNRGHHKNVSTDEDPASARYGETLYGFWVRSVISGWLSAWHLEADMLKKKGYSAFSWRNEMIWYQVVQLGLIVAVYAVWGLTGMLAFIGAAVFGFLMLETVNYIEHYGLRRKKIDGAYYEKVMPVHSWNSDHTVGRIMLFELTRHSDHHYMANRKYQVLRHFDNSPQMPTGYPGMMVLSTIPPLWFAVMHKQIDKYKATTEGMALA